MKGKYFSLALAIALFGNIASADVVLVPQVACGTDREEVFYYWTQFHVVNLSDKAVSGKIEVFRSGGSSLSCFATGMPVVPAVNVKLFNLAAGGQFSVITDPGGRLTTGWARVESSGAIGVVVTLQVRPAHSDGTGGNLLTSTSLIPTAPAMQFKAYALISAPASTGLAVLNPSTTETANLVLTLRDNQGLTAGNETIQLAPQEKIAQFLWENNLFEQVSQIEGTLELSSSMPIAITVIRVDGTYWSTFPAFPDGPQ